MSDKRDFVRHKRRLIREARKIANELHFGSADNRIFGDTNKFCNAIWEMDIALNKMDTATKPFM